MVIGGNIKAPIKWLSNNESGCSDSFTLKRGTRICQICSPDLQPFCIEENIELPDSKRGEGGFTVSLIYGEMSQNEREQILKSFRGGSSRILISTDILARGIDIQQVSLVINYDIPKYRETYIHRIGRSGRYGRKGVSINFVNNDEINQLKDIESFYHTYIEEMPKNFNELI